jgi:EAL domain-containing protein (putative c-di-GMP-specific phosphodiesterase class I)
LSSALGRILDAVSRPVMIDGREVDVSCSIGVSVYPDDGADAETLIKNADVAMYRAKELGRNNFQFYEKQMNVRINERLDMQRSLRRAFEREEFFLHYQPQFSLRSRAAIAAEALARWTDSQFGQIPPERFIPLAEDSGLIVPLGEWILRRACLQMKQWQDAGVRLERIAINLSARQLRAPKFPELVERVLSETVLMAQGDCAISALHALKAMGVALAIDDFGTGYSSLSYLKRFPVARLKVDRSFVRDIVTDAYDAAITYGIIALAHSVGLSVVAEGVETSEQLRVLRDSGCDEAQGTYFGAAGSADDISSYLRSIPQ